MGYMSKLYMIKKREVDDNWDCTKKGNCYSGFITNNRSTTNNFVEFHRPWGDMVSLTL